MLISQIKQGKIALEVIAERYCKRTPRLEVTIVEPLIDKSTRLKWLARLNPKNDMYQKFKEKF